MGGQSFHLKKSASIASFFYLILTLFQEMKTQDIDNSTNESLSKNNYIVIAPATIRPGVEYQLTVHTLRAQGLILSGQIVAKSHKLSLPGPDREEKPETSLVAEAQATFSPAEIGQLTLKVPDNLADQYGTSGLAIRIKATDLEGGPLTGSALTDVASNGTADMVPASNTVNRRRISVVHPPISLRREADLLYNGKTKSYLIQTDKAKYKPSDKVQFRIIALDPSLKPLTGKVSVYITDAKGNRIKQWKNENLNTGTFKGELQLADKAVLGTWQVTVLDATLPQGEPKSKPQGEEGAKQENDIEGGGEGSLVQNAKSFEVEEYILPTYEIKLSLPPYGLLDKKTVKLIGYFEAKYTFGGFVPGKATITLKDTYGEYVPKLGSVKYEQTQLVLETPGSGRTDFEIAINYDDKENFMEDTFVYGHAYSLAVTFIDAFTFKSTTTTQSIQVYSFPLQLSLEGPPYYKPGLPYTLKIEATQVDGKPLSPQDVLAYRKIELKKIFSYSKPHYLTNDTFVNEIGKKIEVTLDAQNSRAYLSFNDTDANVYRLSFEAQYPNQPRTYSLSANKFEEPSEVYLELSDSTQESKVLKLGSEHTVKAIASIPITTLTLIFVSRGRTVRVKTIDGNGTRTVELPFAVDFDLAPSFKIVAYILSPAGNVIADSVDFQVDQLTRNQVTLNFEGSNNNGSDSESKNETVPIFEPGAEAKLKIRTAPGSLLGVLGVDKSVRLLGQGNDLTLEDVKVELDSYGGSARRGQSRWLPWSRAGNSYQIFKDAGLLVLTDADLYVGNEMIYARQYAPVGFAGGPMMDSAPMAYAQASSRSLGKQGAGPNIAARTEFPETWLWEDLIADGQGNAVIRKKVPDTITTWVATAISVNNETGIGISETPAELRVFMPFFVALNLPYSVIRGEKVRIQALVYNYLGQDVQANVQLEPENGGGTAKSYEILDEFHPMHGNVGDQNVTRFKADAHKVVIKAGQIAPVYFYVSPLVVGKIKLKIKAETPTAGDAIEKLLPVKAEGSPLYFSKTFMVNLKPSNSNFNKTFVVPWDVGNMVEASNHLEVSAIGDIMGPSLSSIGNLVRLPYGCGEQNMLNFAPNLYIYSYLKEKSHLTPALKNKIKSYTEQGYQRQLTYQREDGSFSAFGAGDKSGSVWLTAFVLRSFALASNRGLNLIYVDDKVIRDALDFLLDSQRIPGRKDVFPNNPLAAPFDPSDGFRGRDESARENCNTTTSTTTSGRSPSNGAKGRETSESYGDFPELGEVHHKPMQGGTSKGLALTAFVYLALKETQLLASSKGEPALLNQRTARRLNYSLNLAERFMAGRLARDLDNLPPYDLAIVAYALTLAQARDGPRLNRSRRNSPSPAANKTGEETLVPEKATSSTTMQPTRSPSPGLFTMVTERIHDIVSHALHTGLNANEVSVNRSNITNAEPLSQGDLAELSARALQRLMALSKSDGNGDLRFWSQALQAGDSCKGTNTESCFRHEPLSLDYETTSYVLLVLSALDRVDDGLPILRWLVSHRTSVGGFSSTQDTIVALNALAKFSSLLPRVNQNLQISLAGDLTSHEWNLSESNSFVRNVYSFGSTLEKEIHLKAEGSGLALIQVSWAYNVKNVSQGSGFNIDAKTRLKNNTLKVDVCLNYAGAGGRSNMAIVEINAPTGYVIDKESLKPESETSLYAKITELTDAGTKLNLYFDSIGNDRECFKVEMEKLYEVQGIKPSMIKVSDYYQPEYQSSATIQIPDDFAAD